MNYPNILKDEVCTMICDNGASTTYVADLYNIPLKTIEKWVTAYNKNPQHYKQKASFYRPANKESGSKKKYADMNKEELRVELMRRDVELERIKKGYTVRESGGKREYGIFSD